MPNLDITLDVNITNKTTPVAADRVPIIDSETNPDSYKEAELTNLHKALTQATDAQAGTIELATSAEVLTGTDATRAVTPDTLNDILTRVPKDGEMLNGKLSVTVVSNDLVLALKTLAGADPSASDPIYININGTVRTVTAATTCTLADATNWFASGGAELAAKEVDYFAYAIWDSNSSVVAVAPARIPYARLVSDFSATTTNDRHLGNYANFTTTDDVCVIGRFAATLSAAAGHVWTVPTFTGKNLINHPIYETRWLTWAPVPAGYSANPTGTYRYQIVSGNLFFSYNDTGNGTSNATTKSSTLPMSTSSAADLNFYMFRGFDNGAQLATPSLASIGGTSNVITFFKDLASAGWTASGTHRMVGAVLWYPIA